jgi:hypothetical protein
MLKARTLFIAIFILTLAAAVTAQRSGDFPKSSDYVAKNSSLSLLDPSRLHMSHSYSLMYTSSRAGSYSLGMYLNSIEYQVSDPLKIRIDVAYLHQPGALIGARNNSVIDGRILPGISINWQPTKNMFFHIGYRQVPVTYRYSNSNPLLDNYYYSKEEGD